MYNVQTLFGMRQEKLFKLGINTKMTALLETVLYESSFSNTGTIIIKAGVLKNRHPLFFMDSKSGEIDSLLESMKFIGVLTDFKYNRGTFSCILNLELIRRPYT